LGERPRECSEHDWGSTNVRGNAWENAWENAGGNRPQRGASKLTKWQHSDTPSDLDLGLHPGPCFGSGIRPSISPKPRVHRQLVDTGPVEIWEPKSGPEIGASKHYKNSNRALSSELRPGTRSVPVTQNILSNKNNPVEETN
jgi:hypothetical protein